MILKQVVLDLTIGQVGNPFNNCQLPAAFLGAT